MAPMSQWAGIESDAAVARRPPAPSPATGQGSGNGAAGNGATGNGSGRPRPRLKRAERLITGSIDGAVHVLQRRGRHVLVGSALLMIPMTALTLWLSVLAYDDFDRFDSLFGDRGWIGAEAGGAFFALAVQSLTAHLVGAYCAAYQVKYQLGGDPGIREPMVATLRRVPLLLITWALTHWWALLVALGVINAELADLAGVAFFLIPLLTMLSALVVLVVPVMMGERVGVRAIPRGIALARRRFGPVMGFVLANGLIGGFLVTFIALLPAAAEGTGLLTFGSVRWLVQGVAAQVAALVVVPFTALAAAEMYLQVRVHAEGLDIVLAADRAFGSPG